VSAGFLAKDYQNLRLAKQVAHKLTGAGFEKTVLLITSEAPHAGLFADLAQVPVAREHLVSTITVSDGEIRDCSCFLCQEN
jgi:hypothetical protein